MNDMPVHAGSQTSVHAHKHADHNMHKRLHVKRSNKHAKPVHIVISAVYKELRSKQIVST